MRSRQLGLAALFAAGVLLLGNPGWSQEGKDTPTTKGTKAEDDQAAKDAARVAAAKADREATKKLAIDTDKTVAELKKTVADLKGEIAAVPTDKAVADLKKTVADLKGELSAVKKDFGKLDASVTGATGDLKSFKSDTAAGLAKVDGAAKSIEGMQKSIADAKTEFDASKKGVDESLKGVADIKATAEGAKTKAQSGDIGRGDTAWMLVASAFVMLMLPGLALFYGGMVRRRNILATMMQSMACLSVVGVFWVAFGYGLAFGPSQLMPFGAAEGGVIGWSWDLFFLQGVGHTDVLPGYNIPVYVHVMFQGMFAIITPALISGAVAERVRFWPFCIFTILWVSFVYCPLAHMVWAFDWFDMTIPAAKRGAAAIGYLGKMGALDYAGGTVVHIAAGFAGLAACLVLRRRDGYPKTVIHPNSMVITLLGAGLLWFGWFGFNGGSALASDGQASSAFAATQAAAATAGLVWIFIEWILKGKPTALGLASGIVAGLVAVTPASGYVYVWGGAAIGAAAAIGCYVAVMVKNMLGYDDSLDAFGVHGVGGFIGAVMTGLFCYSAIASTGGDGYFAMKGQDAKIAMMEKPGASDALKKEAEAKKADFEKLKPGYDALVTKGKDKLTDDEKKVFDAGELAEMFAADADKAFTGAEAELKALKETVAKRTADPEALKTPFTQLIIQAKAATFSAVYALAASLLLVIVVQLITLGNFSTSKKNETIGLDQSEHGETGFDFGLATETTALRGGLEPKAALTPKVKSTRFELAVEGVAHEDIAKLWTGLCQPSDKPVSPDFLAVYPSVTTFSGNHFHCRGADAPAVAARLESLFKKLLPGKPVKVVRL